MSDLPKMLSKREIELEELEEAKYVQSLRDDIEKLQEQLNTAKKALTEIAEILNNKIHKCDYSCDNFCKFDGSLNMYSVENVQSVIDSSLAAIGGDK